MFLNGILCTPVLREKQNESADGVKSARVKGPPKAQGTCESFQRNCAYQSQNCDKFLTILAQNKFSSDPTARSSSSNKGPCMLARASPVALVVKKLLASVGDIRPPGSIPGLGRSPAKGHGSPLQYSGLESPPDRGTW